jgi:hypothetical protein
VPTPEIADKWQRNEKVSEWDDSRSVTFTLASEGPAAGTGGNERSVTLVVFCKGKAKLTTFGLLGIQPESDIDNGVVVNLRFDKTPAVSQRWGLAPIEQEGFSVTQAQAIANMKRLAASSTLLVGFSPMLGRQQTARFDVRGFNRHIKEIATACGWSPWSDVQWATEDVPTTAHNEEGTIAKEVRATLNYLDPEGRPILDLPLIAPARAPVAALGQCAARTLPNAAAWSMQCARAGLAVLGRAARRGNRPGSRRALLSSRAQPGVKPRL